MRIFLGSTVSHDSAMVKSQSAPRALTLMKAQSAETLIAKAFTHDTLLNPLPEDFSSSGEIFEKFSDKQQFERLRCSDADIKLNER